MHFLVVKGLKRLKLQGALCSDPQLGTLPPDPNYRLALAVPYSSGGSPILLLPLPLDLIIPRVDSLSCTLIALSVVPCCCLYWPMSVIS